MSDFKLRSSGWLLMRLASLRYPGADPRELEAIILLGLHARDIAARLVRIYEANPERDNYISIGLGGRQRGYVQALFIDGNSRLLMEAESGFYAQEEGEPRSFRVSERGLRALAALGFSTDDSDGNFQRFYDFEPATVRRDFLGAAVYLLKALAFAYGAGPTSVIEISAPYAPERDKAAIREIDTIVGRRKGPPRSARRGP